MCYENLKEKDCYGASREAINIALDGGFTPVERELLALKSPYVLSMEALYVQRRMRLDLFQTFHLV